MTTLQLTSTATAFFACLSAILVASSTSVPSDALSEVTASHKSSCLLQRNAQLKIRPNNTLSQNVVASVQSGLTSMHTDAMSEATGWLSDIFAEEVEPIANSTTVRRARLHPVRWSKNDKGFFIVFTIALVCFDYFVLQRLNVSGLRQHLALVAFWILVGMGYNLFIAVRHGSVAGVQWCSGYLLEWLLSMDNLFIFHLIFRLYKTPPEVIHKALFLGILSAVTFRFTLFAVVRQLLDLVTWFRFIFGGFLIWSGIQAAKDDEEEDLTAKHTVKSLQWLLGDRLLDGYGEKEGSLVIWRNGKLTFTLLFPVVCCLECTELIFAVDSVSAKAAQIPNVWDSVTSAVLAMFGLRTMFFVVQDLVQLFGLLKYGLCFILVFIGVELMISDYVALPPHVVCVVILSVFSISIVGSSALASEPVAAAEGLFAASPAMKSSKASSP